MSLAWAVPLLGPMHPPLLCRGPLAASVPSVSHFTFHLESKLSASPYPMAQTRLKKPCCSCLRIRSRPSSHLTQPHRFQGSADSHFLTDTSLSNRPHCTPLPCSALPSPHGCPKFCCQVLGPSAYLSTSQSQPLDKGFACQF